MQQDIHKAMKRTLDAQGRVPLHILLIEDDEDDSIIIREYLENFKVFAPEFYWIRDAREVEEELVNRRPDILLVDYFLGSTTGLELLARLRKKGSNVPVIFLTGNGNLENDLNVMKAGASDYLVKGEFHAAQLERSVRYAMNQFLSDRRSAEAELRYRKLFDNSLDGIYEIDEQGRFLNVNPALAKMLGHNSPEALLKSGKGMDRAFFEEKGRFEVFLEQLRSQGQVRDFESRVCDNSGKLVWVSQTGRFSELESSGTIRIEGGVRDITVQKRTEEKLFHTSRHDSLTDFPNRLEFMEKLGKALRGRRERDGSYTVVIYLDVDDFKLVNDAFGHALGDTVIVQIANRLYDCMRSSDLIARLGGDEFAILLAGIESFRDVKGLTEKITRSFDEPLIVNATPLNLTASMGISISNNDKLTPGDMMRNADTALFRAKELGRGRAVLFNRTMHNRVRLRMNTENELRKAIENEEFCVFYQPIISSDDDRIVGFESLVRWNNPEKGLVAPIDFIPVAEATGLIVPIGEWVLRESCRMMKHWRANGYPNLVGAVNTSVRQFQETNMRNLMEGMLHEFDLTPDAIKLEVTESIAMKNVDYTIGTFRELERLGTEISIDDFGTGYSSLSYLKKFPFHTLKIDRSFVMEVPGEQEDEAIVEAILAMAKSLGLSVVAEGVETEEQLQFLKSRGCDYIQGYFYSKPLPDVEFEKFMKDFKGGAG